MEVFKGERKAKIRHAVKVSCEASGFHSMSTSGVKKRGMQTLHVLL